MKKLSKSEYRSDNCYLRFVSVTAVDPHHYMVLPANDKWENIRYLLEKSVGCFKFTLPTKVVQNAFVTAQYEYSVIGSPPGTVLTSKTQIYGGDILVITRHPQPKHLHAYIPAKYWSDLGDMGQTKESEPEKAAPATSLPDETNDNLGSEEKKLERLLTQSGTESSVRDIVFLPPVVVRILRQHIMHPTDYATFTTPHPLFVCKYCGNQGKHFHNLCPFTATDVENYSTDLITKVRRIVGIPKSRLRLATQEEITLGQYYLNENDEKVVVLKQTVDVLVSDKKDLLTKTKRKREEEHPHQELSSDDLLAMMDMEEYESHYRFSFEDFIEEKEQLEQQKEDQFYEAHPHLKKKKNQICTHYYRGMCHKGKLECEFLHTGDETYIAICQFYVNNQCTDSQCIFRHPPKHLFHNECNAFNRGFCEKGPLCKYKHKKYRHPVENPNLDKQVCNLMTTIVEQKIK
jgi:hypothetical protein